MFKGLMAALVALISTLQLDRYLTNGRYTDAAWICCGKSGARLDFEVHWTI
ncbi:hypothetical protein [Bradyrhizobium liaoningense]|uniref:hypothetical protein n=1 Tax=Bradyrhizobium liaoningense TaxID=43992 RepID=UPI001BA84887|nr:hypothetical protein [Bradyrhizobium liaoningense]MBR1064944.1 hypothetical protein [Bradyrhizobium liaoningense]